ncbi:homocysteine S-methyltransferase family protein [Streptomyces sp. NPDC053720]|uniref:homocysteine S-methyltransferase family protein n=1 Tax=Streptomyces sp. NPDC053720 TaxID=3154855 RepID=UPI003427296F
MTARGQSLRAALATRVVVGDGAMGTMLQAQDPSLDDFENLEGCNEVLNVTRPDIVRSVHEAYFAAGVDCVETNTFGTNLAALGEYGIPGRIHELALSGARLAREVADGFATPDRPRWVLGSVGPGTKLPTLGHAPYAALRDGYEENVAGLVEGGVDAILVETSQDLLQTKAAVLGAHRALRKLGTALPIITHVTVETTGAMLLGSEIGAALTALEPLGIDVIGLNCATGPAEMGEHLRYLAQHARIAVSCMPNAGLPVLGKDGAHYPLSPEELADAHETFVREYGLALVGGCCGTTPEHLRQTVERVRGLDLSPRDPRPEPGAASLYQTVPFKQDASYLAIGERTNANGSERRGRRLCLADFFRPEDSGETDVIEMQVVTVGNRVSVAANEIFAANAYRDYMELHGLSVQLTEALAEYWHGRVRTELGMAGADPDNLDAMFRTEYQGCRYSLGYPACPNLEDRTKIMNLLEPERIGVNLSEEFQLHPEQSTDAITIHHPEAGYFNAHGGPS